MNAVDEMYLDASARSAALIVRYPLLWYWKFWTEVWR
jgi:hypothetical protein